MKKGILCRLQRHIIQAGFPAQAQVVAPRHPARVMHMHQHKKETLNLTSTA